MKKIAIYLLFIFGCIAASAQSYPPFLMYTLIGGVPTPVSGSGAVLPGGNPPGYLCYGLNGSGQPTPCVFGGTGVTSINTVAGAFTFTGSAVSCTSTTCTFTGVGSGIGSIAWAIPSWLTASPSTISASGTQTFSPTTGQTSHQVIGTCGAATTFGPCALVAGDLPAVTNIGGGAANEIVYQTATSTTGFIAAAASCVLSTNGSNVPSCSTTLPSGLSATNLTLVTPALGTPASGVITNLTGTCTSCTANLATTATTSTNLSGGALGSVPYQSATNTTVFVASPTTNGLYLGGWKPTGSAIAPTALNAQNYIDPNVPFNGYVAFAGASGCTGYGLPGEASPGYPNPPYNPAPTAWPLQLLALPPFAGNSTGVYTCVDGSGLSNMISIYTSSLHSSSPIVTGKPGILLIQVYGNDVANIATSGGGSCTSSCTWANLAAYEVSYLSYLTTAEADGWKVGYMGQPPGLGRQQYDALRLQFNEYNKTLICAQSASPCISYYVDITGRFNTPTNTAYYQADGLHPNQEMSNEIAIAFQKEMFTVGRTDNSADWIYENSTQGQPMTVNAAAADSTTQRNTAVNGYSSTAYLDSAFNTQLRIGYSNASASYHPGAQWINAAYGGNNSNPMYFDYNGTTAFQINSATAVGSTATWTMPAPTLSNVTGSTQCLQANSSGVVSGTGTACGSGGGTTTNALTANNSGSGAASGTTFNGSAAVTFSYNTFGAAPTASPTFTGTATAAALTATGAITFTGIEGAGSYCVQVSSSGVLSNTGAACGSGSGAVNSVTNSDGTLTISPTTGSVVASLALGHANTWTGNQTSAKWIASTGFDISGATTAAHYLRNNGTDYVDSAIQSADVPTLNQNTTGSAGSLSAALALSGLATQTANTIVGNGTSGSASPTALTMPSCSGASNALTWTTSGGSTAFGCNTISGGGTPAYPLTITGGVSGGVVYGSSSTQLTVSPAGTANVLMKWGGSATAPGNSSITDNATSVTTTDTGGWVGPTFTTNGTSAGFMDYAQGSTSASVAPCNTATSICEQAPTSVTSYLLVKPGVGAAGVKSGRLASSVITEGISGDANHSAAVVIGSGTSIGSTSLCSTTVCPAGTYRVNVYVDITTACGTTGTYTVNLIYTDDQGSKTSVVNLNGTGAVPATGLLTTTSTSNFGQESQIIRSTGAASINYSTTAVACGTAGPMVGNLYLSVEQVQ